MMIYIYLPTYLPTYLTLILPTVKVSSRGRVRVSTRVRARFRVRVSTRVRAIVRVREFGNSGKGNMERGTWKGGNKV